MGPATAMQHGLLLESTLAGRPWANLEQIVLEGPAAQLDFAALGKAWAQLALRHDALRMCLRPDGAGGIGQKLLESAKPDIAFHDLTGMDAAAQARHLETFLKADRLAGLELAAKPGWRVALFAKGARAEMVWTIHHALIDGTSMAIVLEELGHLLRGAQLPEVPTSRSFTAFSQAGFEQDKLGAETFFAAMFADGHGAAPIVSGNAAPVGRMAIVGERLDEAQSDALRAIVRDAGATTLNAVQLAWSLVLARWTGQAEACFGLVDSGRGTIAGFERTVGCLISTLPMRVQMAADESVLGLLRRLRQTTLAMRQHSHSSVTEVRRWAGLPGKAPLFDTIVMHAHASLAARIAALGADWSAWSVDLFEEGTAAMTLAVADDRRLHVLLEHDPARVPDQMAQAILRQVVRLLGGMAAADAQSRLADLEMLDASETAELRSLGQPQMPLAPHPPCIATRFEAHAAKSPTAVAVIDPASGKSLCYQDLDLAANALAHRLLGAGIGAGDIVALHLPRGADHITALLAVLKLGAAFLPLDTDLPSPWLQDLMARAGAKALVTLNGATAPPADVVIEITPAGGAAKARAYTRPERPAPDPMRRAYVLYTSGSSGAPKAVQGLCGALSAHATAIGAALGLKPQDRVLQFAGLGFDVALEEILPSLLAGATVVIRDAAAAGSMHGFAEFLGRHKVTLANLPASFWHVLVDEIATTGLRLPPSLRLVVTGSERIRPQALRRWRALMPAVGWMNGYGPTEATITATLYDLPVGAALPDQMDEVPIGRPLAHASVAVCAFDGTLAPRGGRGMLWIGGAAVTGGYLGDPAQTARAFRPAAWNGGENCYLTGDQARWRDDGLLEFLGREDRQIKLRGQRIDLNQVESLIAALPNVRQAHVAAIGGENLRLVAWVVCEANSAVEQVTQAVAQRLPRAMRPQVIGVTALPVTANGKVDTAALPDLPAAQGHKAARLSPLAAEIAACMAQVLERDDVPADVSFSDLGGDSLLALRLVSLIETRTGHALQTANLHHDGSALGLAQMLQSGETAPRYTIPIQPQGHKPAFFAIHVLGRNEDLFRPLAAALGPDYPVFGLSVGIPRNLDDISVERTAQAYFNEIQTYHPTGPICLGAVSMAAYFAYELAQRLRAAGREVRVLAVLDAIGPDGRPALSGLAKMRAHVAQIREHGLGHFGRAARNRVDRYRERREALRSAPDQVNAPNLIAANVCAVESYQPKPYEGAVTVFRADHSFWDSPAAIASALGWASVAKGGLVMHDLPGTHLSILHPGNVEVLAAHLKRLIG